MPRKSLQLFSDRLNTLLSSKENKTIYYGGLLGTYDANGAEIVDVPGKSNFCYVRLNGSFNEVIEAYNTTVSTQFNLAVKVAKRPDESFYEVIGLNVQQYVNWGDGGQNAFLPKHANTHTHGIGDGVGTDPVFIYKRQLLQPMGVHPFFTGVTMTAYVEGDYYVWNNEIVYFSGTTTADLTPLKPTDGKSRYVTIYLDGNTNSLGYKTGTLFSKNFFFGNTADIPEVLPQEGLQLATVYLVSGTYQLSWDNIYDVRNFLNAGGTIGIGSITGTTYGSILYGGPSGTIVWNSQFKYSITGSFLEAPIIYINPTGTTSPIILGTNAQNQLVTGLDSDKWDGQHLPSQIGNSGKYLQTDGSNISWSTVSAGGGNSGGGDVLAIFRWSGLSGTATFDFPDIVDKILSLTINGFAIDPLQYTLVNNNTQFTLNNPLNQAAIIVGNYVIQQIS